MKVVLSRPIDNATTIEDMTSPTNDSREGHLGYHTHRHPSFQRSLAPPNRAPPRRVDHTYRDYSNFPLDEFPTGKKAPANFPSKLHEILSSHEYSHIISWMPHGRAWKIHNKDLLMREVVPKYFVQSRYESFTRQLNGWGFKRLHQSGNDFDAYYHECFLSGLLHLTALMKRVAPNQGKLLPHVEGEPNFYEINHKCPLPPPMMPYHGHYPHSPSHMARAGYGAPPEPPTGYHSSPNHYSPYPSNYPPSPPHYTGHYGDPHVAAVDYASQSDYSPYLYYPTQCSHHPQEHYNHYPYPPGPLYGTQSYYGNPPPNTTDPGKSKEVPSALPQGSVKEERLPAKDEAKEDYIELLSILS